MVGNSFYRHHPIRTLITIAFVVAFAVTAAYWGGLVPGVPKTIPMFVNMVMVTGVLLTAAMLAWISLLDAR